VSSPRNTLTMANNRQKFYALAIYWLRDYSRNFGVETLVSSLRNTLITRAVENRQKFYASAVV
jgi:hypothetical protein